MKDGHYLCCRKASESIVVWIAENQVEKQDAAPKGAEKNAEQHGEDGDRLGIMNSERFKDWRFAPMLLLSKELLHCKTLNGLEDY